jgi:hypothetical protein
MTSSLTSYLFHLKECLREWEHTEVISIRSQWVNENVGTGFFRARVKMANGDLLEIAEFFVLEANAITVGNYKFHWQDSQGCLIKRWDNAPHHPEVKGFPHHLHDSSEENVMPGVSNIDTEMALQLISQCLTSQEES